MKKIFLVTLLSLAASGAFAQQQATCPEGTTTCSINQPQQGDTANPSHAENTTSISSLSGTSSASNASGVNINPELQNRNAATQTIEGGNTHSSAAGGAANGNRSDIANNSAGGASTASSGGNTLNGGPVEVKTGPNTLVGGDTAVKAAGGDSAVKASGNSDNKLVGGSLTGTNTNKNALGQNADLNASTRSGSDNQLQVDASDRSSQSYTDNSKTVFIPPIIPPTPPSTLAVGNIIKETTACGPLQRVVKTPVNGKFFGLFSSEDVPQGFTYDLEPEVDAQGRLLTYSELPLADGSGYRMIGNQAIIFATVIGTSGARNVALGGGGSSGSWGQGGGGTSAANQQLVTNIQLRACDMGTMKYKVVQGVRPAVKRPTIDDTDQ